MRETGGSPARPLFIGGKSMGGRVASLLVEDLAALRTPTLILQGERDSFGRREEVETYSLAPAVQLGWIAQRRPQLQAHPQFGPQRGGELGDGGGEG